jgi:Ca2+-binding EF-hand superfamily protein
VTVQSLSGSGRMQASTGGRRSRAGAKRVQWGGGEGEQEVASASSAGRTWTVAQARDAAASGRLPEPEPEPEPELQLESRTLPPLPAAHRRRRSDAARKKYEASDLGEGAEPPNGARSIGSFGAAAAAGDAAADAAMAAAMGTGATARITRTGSAPLPVGMARARSPPALPTQGAAAEARRQAAARSPQRSARRTLSYSDAASPRQAHGARSPLPSLEGRSISPLKSPLPDASRGVSPPYLVGWSRRPQAPAGSQSSPAAAAPPKLAELVDPVQAAFERLDINGNGTLDMSELEAAMTETGYLRGPRMEWRRKFLRKTVAELQYSYEAQLDSLLIYFARVDPRKSGADVRALVESRRKKKHRGQTGGAAPGMPQKKWEQLCEALRQQYTEQDGGPGGLAAGEIELRYFVEIWEHVTGERFEETKAISHAEALRLSGREPRVDPLRDTFNLYDADGSGSLDKDEVEKVLERLHLFDGPDKAWGKTAHKLIEEFDSDNDGTLCLDEFRDLWSHLTQRPLVLQHPMAQQLQPVAQEELVRAMSTPPVSPRR